jgi:hypothetical protein
MAKRIRVSDDNRVTWWTLPGNTGDMRRELASVNDTVFGQEFQSEDVQIGTWTVTANSFYKGVAGYVARLRQGGTPVAMVDQATTLVSGKTYQITDITKRIIDYNTVLTVKDNAVDQTANVISVDYLNGTVTFAAAYAPTGPITVTGSYVPTTVIAKSKAFTLTQTAAEIDTTDYETAQSNLGWRTYDPGLKTVRLEISGIYDETDGLQAALASRALMYVEISPANTNDTLFRGFFKRANFGQSGDVGALEERTLTLNLFAPDGALLERPFGWYLTNNSTLNTAIKKVLAAWENSTILDLQYLPNGTTGFVGDAIVTETSLSNALDGLNEFRYTFRGSGSPDVVV